MNDHRSLYTYNNPNDHYSPSTFVKFGNSMHDTTIYNGIDIGYSPLENGWQISALLFVLGVISILSLNLGLLCRCCVESCFCYQPVSEGGKNYKLINQVAFIGLCILVLVFDQLVFVGNTEVTSGVTNLSNNLNSLETTVNSIKKQLTILSNYGGTLTTEYKHINQSQCHISSYGFLSIIKSYNKSVSEFYSDVGPITDKINLVNDDLNQYGNFYRNLGLYVIWALSIISIFIYLICHYCETECGIKFSILFSQAVFLLYLLLGLIWCALVAYTGYFCMKPSYYTIAALPSGTNSLQTYANYYATCVGNNQFIGYVNASIADMSQIQVGISQLLNTTSCSNNKYLLEMNATTYSIDNSIHAVNKSIACQPIQQLWLDSVNNGVCGDIYTGIFYIWWSQLLTSFFLFFLIIAASIIYQYYGIKFDDDEDGGEEYDYDEDLENLPDDLDREVPQTDHRRKDQMKMKEKKKKKKVATDDYEEGQDSPKYHNLKTMEDDYESPARHNNEGYYPAHRSEDPKDHMDHEKEHDDREEGDHSRRKKKKHHKHEEDGYKEDEEDYDTERKPRHKKLHHHHHHQQDDEEELSL